MVGVVNIGKIIEEIFVFLKKNLTNRRKYALVAPHF